MGRYFSASPTPTLVQIAGWGNASTARLKVTRATSATWVSFSAVQSEPVQDKVRRLQKEDPRERARRGAPQARGGYPPLLLHAMHRGGAEPGGGGPRRLAYDRPSR